MSPYRKQVFVVSGKIVDYWYAPDSDEKFEGVVECGSSLLIPANAMHGFFSLEESTLLYVLENHFSAEFDRNIYWRSPELPFSFLSIPTHRMVTSAKDEAAPFWKAYDYLVFGSTGFLGSYAVTVLRAQGRSVFCSQLRLHEIAEIQNVIRQTRCKFVICAAGISGNPTTLWCEDHEKETFQVNLLQLLNLIEVTERAGVHLTVFGTALLYKPILPMIPITEEVKPTLNNLVYVRLRVELESHLHLYNHVLYLRVIYPVLGNGHPKCFLTKMKGRMDSVHNVPVAMTVMPDLFPLLSILVEKHVVGVINFVNTGTIFLPDFMRMFGVECKHDGDEKIGVELCARKLSEASGRMVSSVRDALGKIIANNSAGGASDF